MPHGLILATTNEDVKVLLKTVEQAVSDDPKAVYTLTSEAAQVSGKTIEDLPLSLSQRRALHQQNNHG